MNDRDFAPGGETPTREDRQRHLVAAAEVLRVWARARRATWRASSPDTRDATVPESHLSVRSVDEPEAPKPRPLVPVFAYESPKPVQPPTFPRKPPVGKAPKIDTAEPPARGVPALLPEAPHARWLSRLGALAGLAALLAGGAWAVRTYGGRLTAPQDGVVATPNSASSISTAPGDTTANPRPSGRLEVTSDPPGSQVMIDGKERGVTPLTIENLGAGQHDIVLVSTKGQLRRTVNVVAGATTRLSEAIYSGWLQVLSPIDLQIREDSRALRLDDRNQVLLSPGSHELVFENASLGYREARLVDVKPGGIASVSIVPPPSTISVASTVPAEVLVDGVRAGATPLVDHPIALGTREIIVRSTAGEERRFPMTIGVRPARLDVNFSSPAR